MMSRGTASIFWPGFTTDIQEVRKQCRTCDSISPSQPHLPAAEPFVAVLPFQAVATDYFNVRGKNYLLTVDRFTNWPDLRQASAATAEAGAAGLMKALRQLFAQFGVPEHLSSDGGPEYTSHILKDFMSRWGITHRLSSAYHPQSNGDGNLHCPHETSSCGQCGRKRKHKYRCRYAWHASAPKHTRT